LNLVGHVRDPNKEERIVRAVSVGLFAFTGAQPVDYSENFGRISSNDPSERKGPNRSIRLGVKMAVAECLNPRRLSGDGGSFEQIARAVSY
jgi:hypothetical protein